MTTNRARVPAGATTGGEFAMTARGEPAVVLAPALTFGPIDVKGRRAETHTIVGETEHGEVHVIVRVTHWEGGQYGAVAARRLYDKTTGETTLAPTKVRSLGEIDSGSKRFSIKHLLQACEKAAADLTAAVADPETSARYRDLVGPASSIDHQLDEVLLRYRRPMR